MLSKQIRFVNFKRNENQTQRMHTCWSETVSAGSGSAAHCYSCYKKKEKRKRSCLAASLTDSADTKEEDSLFSHRYLCPSPSTRTPLNKKKKLSSLWLLSVGQLGLQTSLLIVVLSYICSTVSPKMLQSFKLAAAELISS